MQDFGGFRRAVSESFVPLKVTCPKPHRFWGAVRTEGVDGIHFAEIAAAGHVVERTPELIAESDPDYFKISLQLAGTGVLVQGNRQATLRPGDLAIYDTTLPYTLGFDDEFRAMVVMFPRRGIDLPTELVGQLTAVRINGDDGCGKLVVPFLRQLEGNLDQFSGPTGARLARNTVDLIATILCDELDIRKPDPHHVLGQRIRQYINAHLGDTDLSPQRIAAAHFISTRHLHAIFREQGTTVSAWIRSQRLERCRRDLADPVLADRTVAGIGAKWGFLDAAHFSRVFREAYGSAPSSVRA